MGRNNMDVPTLTGAIKASKGMFDIFAPNVDYDVLEMQSGYLEDQASNLELQVQQQANYLREQYLETMGSAEYGAARRGVKVGEGNIQENIEESAGNVGKDIQTAKENVKFKAGQLRSSAKSYKIAAEGSKNISLTEKIGKTASTLDSINNSNRRAKILKGAPSKILKGAPLKKKKKGIYDEYKSSKSVTRSMLNG